MKLEDAIKSGKKFKRTGLEGEIFWHHPGVLDKYQFFADDVIADWEIEETKVEISKTQFLNAVSEVMKEYASKKRIVFINPDGTTGTPFDVERFEGWSELVKKLGL